MVSNHFWKFQRDLSNFREKFRNKTLSRHKNIINALLWLILSYQIFINDEKRENDIEKKNLPVNDVGFLLRIVRLSISNFHQTIWTIYSKFMINVTDHTVNSKKIKYCCLKKRSLLCCVKLYKHKKLPFLEISKINFYCARTGTLKYIKSIGTLQ